LLVIAFYILRDGTVYREKGGNYFDQLKPERTKRKLTARLERMGFDVILRNSTHPAPLPSASLPSARRRGRRPCKYVERGIDCKPALLPLPVEPFRYYQYGERTVHLDGCVEVEAAYYSAPPGWISRRVQVQWNDTHVRLIDPRNGQLLREHLRQQRGRHRIQDEDKPSRTPLSTEQLLSRAEVAGHHIEVLCRTMHNAQGQAAVRHILGVLALAKKYGIPSTDEAGAMGLETGACEYRFVRL
jgi:hypothetical protein